jgi:hypothetical protein
MHASDTLDPVRLAASLPRQRRRLGITGNDQCSLDTRNVDVSLQLRNASRTVNAFAGRSDFAGKNERDERHLPADLHIDQFRSRRNSFASPLDGVTNVDHG